MIEKFRKNYYFTRRYTRVPLIILVEKLFSVVSPKNPLKVSGAPKGWQRGLAPLKGEKIESFVAFTRNLIPKSLKPHHFLNETS